MQTILDLQDNENGNGNNYFISYVCQTFNSYVIPHIKSLSNTFNYRNIPNIPDVNPRNVVVNPKYKENPKNVYN